MTRPGLASPTPSDAFLSGDSDVELHALDPRPASPDARTVSPFRLSSSSDEPFDLDDEDVDASDKEDDWHLLGQRKAQHPLVGKSQAKLAAMGRDYAVNELVLRDEREIRNFELGAVAAGVLDKKGAASRQELREMYESIEGLDEGDRRALVREVTNKWAQPLMLYYVVVICSVCASVQGMDETVINGAQSIYKDQFGIGGESYRDTWLLGLTNAAPYLCCAVLGCWLTSPMNKAFGRRGTIFIACSISAVACVWTAFTNSWWSMFIARFVLGLGIGPNSATAPIFAAECSPTEIRGALTMQWQVWTAFGIMLGYIADLSLLDVPDNGVTGLAWRLMMASAAIPAVIACFLVYLGPESPRWYLTRDQHAQAYAAMVRLRNTRVQAARDLFYAHVLMREEKKVQRKGSRVLELVTVRRNRNAMIASEILMFMQQFCGVNVIAYYSSEIFLSANFSLRDAYTASLGFGIINFVFAIPAFYTIDTFGRRNLLLTTFPLMAICLLFTGLSFLLPNATTAQIVCIATGVYLFGTVYSPGAGPVPFTYSAEAYPLRVRTLGMSLATATTWFFNFVLAVTWPSLQAAFTNAGAFAWYAGWNVAGFFAVLFFVPETKGRSLEELDGVFDVGIGELVRYGKEESRWWVQRYFYGDTAAVKPVVPRGGGRAGAGGYSSLG